MARVLFAAAWLLIGFSSASAQVEMNWKLAEGKSFVIEETVTIQQTSKVGGRTSKTSTRQKKLSTIKVQGLDEQGNARLEMRLDSIAATGDGAKEQAAIHAKMAGALFRVTLSPGMKITGFEGYDKLVAQVTGGVPNDVATFKRLVTEETMKRMIQQTFSLVPDGAVQRGDTWRRPTTLQVSTLGRMDVDRTFTYVGPGRLQGVTCERLQMKAQARFQPAADNPVLSVVKADVALFSYEGTAHFDTHRGRLVQSEQKARLKGDFLVKNAAGQQGPLSLLLLRTSRRRILDPP